LRGRKKTKNYQKLGVDQRGRGGMSITGID